MCIVSCERERIGSRTIRNYTRFRFSRILWHASSWWWWINNGKQPALIWMDGGEGSSEGCWVSGSCTLYLRLQIGSTLNWTSVSVSSLRIWKLFCYNFKCGGNGYESFKGIGIKGCEPWVKGIFILQLWFMTQFKSFNIDILQFKSKWRYFHK